PVRFECPACHADRAFRWDVRNPVVLHWVLNPGLAVNELLLGQRIPKVMLLCRKCLTSAVRCEACRWLIPQEGFGERALGNWAGYGCAECESRIPMLRNLLAGMVVGLGKWAVGWLVRKKR